MTEEEKKAIERLSKRLYIEKYTKNIGTAVYIKDIEIVLNLILSQQAEIKEKKDQIRRLTVLSVNLNKEIDKLKLIAKLALKNRPIEISKKAINELSNTIEIEQAENIMNNSYIFRAR